MRILTIDLGTSATKVALWSEDGPIAVGRATVDVEHPRPGWVEQDPETWWSSTLDACAQLPEGERGQVDAVGFSSQRDTFVPVTTAGEPIGRAIASADRRAGEMVASLGPDFQVLTGVVPDAGTVAAKVAWIREHEPDRLSGGQRWIMGPRDLVAFRLTGRGVTDTSVASRTGLLALDGAGLDGAELLPEVVGPTTIVGKILPAMASSLGVPAGTPVVAGAGDRACELLGVAATTARPMVSWGSIAGVSVPVGHVPPPDPGIVVSRGALGGYVMEADLSAAGSAMAWLGRLTGRRRRDDRRRTRGCQRCDACRQCVRRA
jgi:xylulokinase